MTRQEKIEYITALRERLVREARTDLLPFTRATMPTFDPAEFHIRYYHVLTLFAEGKIKKLMVFMPPQHGKSEGSTRRLPAYMLGRNPDNKIAVVSYSAPKARKFNREIQRIIDTPEYAEIFPDSCMLLVDTYDTLRSGVPNAIKVFNELKAKGHKPVGIRMDSGDLAYLSKRARTMLDDAGFAEAKICASGDLDETVIRDLKAQGAKIDLWGVGTKLITSMDFPALGGVYKMAAEIVDGKLVPKIKLSENVIKMTNPGYKKVYRFYSNTSGMALADLIALEGEELDFTRPLTIYHPEHRYKSKTLYDYNVRELLVPLFIDGRQVYDCPSMADIQRYAKAELSTFWEESKRLMNPHVYNCLLYTSPSPRDS